MVAPSYTAPCGPWRLCIVFKIGLVSEPDKGLVYWSNHSFSPFDCRKKEDFFVNILLIPWITTINNDYIMCTQMYYHKTTSEKVGMAI
jgi:hypothetical protein